MNNPAYLFEFKYFSIFKQRKPQKRRKGRGKYEKALNRRYTKYIAAICTFPVIPVFMGTGTFV